jgi:sulfoxide reductase heme-binding subunit YedZ
VLRRAAAPLVCVAALVPVTLLVRGMLVGGLGVNPAETIQLQTGRWALKFLLLTLAITPVRRLTGWNRLVSYRRTLGLFAFFYGVLHFLAYWSFDLAFDFTDIVADVVRRPFILMGTLALLTMLPLAITSTRGWIRRLGKRWVQLHRLIYVSAVCAVVHFAWKVKVFSGDPVVYAAVLTALLGFRVLWLIRTRRKKAVVPISPR